MRTIRARRSCFVLPAAALLLCGLCLAASVLALDPASARFRRLDSATGLSQDSVLAMAEDRHGWIWLGTQDGLNRFDGYDVVTYHAEAGARGQLWSNWITALCIDAAGDLWVGTSGGLFRRHEADDGFEPVPLRLPDGRRVAQPFVYAIHRDAGNRLWVGSDQGLSRIDPAGAPAAGATTWTWLSTDDPAPHRIRAIASAADGRLWLGSDRGVARFDPEASTFERDPRLQDLDPQPVNGMLVDRAGALWIATDPSGLHRLDPLAGTRLRIGHDTRPGIAFDRTHALFQARDGAIWLGSEAGAYRILDADAAQPSLQPYLHRPHDATSVGVGRVVSFLESSDGSFWVGSWEGGAARLNPAFSRMLSFNPDMAATAGLKDARVQALAADGEWLWLGTNRGVYRLHGRDFRLQALPALAEVTTYSLRLAGDSAWIGSGSGLLRYHREQDRVEAVDPLDELRGARIRRLFVDADRLWLYAELHGLYLLSLPDLAVIAHHSLPGNANHIGPFDDRQVAVSAVDGLHLFDRASGAERRFVPANRDGGEDVLPNAPSALLASADGRYFVSAYGAGLLELRLPGDARQAVATRRLASTPALANNGVNAILPDRRGRLWLATDRGISMFDPANGQVDNFGADDGALTRGYYFSAAATLADGRLAFGSKHGVTVFDPERVTWPAAPNAPLITALEREGQAVASAGQQPGSPLPEPIQRLDHLQLPPGWGHNLGFRFASVDFVAPERLRYRYQLEGFDTQWIEVDARRRQASFTNLPPREYTLRIKAVDPFGQESPETRLQIRLQPHPWQTWWARLLVAATLAAAAVLAWRRRIGHLRRRSRQLEDMVDERTHALREAKGEAEAALQRLQATQQDLIRSEKLSALGQLVAGVAHEVNTPLGVALTASSHLGDEIRLLRQKIDGGRLSRSEFERYLGAAGEGCDIIQRNLDRAADLIRNFKQVSVDRSAEGRRRFLLLDMLQELTQSLRLLWKNRPITLEIDCPAEIALDSFPGVIGQIVTNLAQNAAIHAFEPDQPGHMRLQVRALPQERIELQFSDDGRGIPAEQLDRIFEPFYTTRRHAGGTGLGLHIVHNLATEKLGGSIAVHSVPGQGTRFVLTMPRTTP